ncbi:MAG: precorrin-6y C5,15-methyltransferase (decarboxylating) subunit CbiE [Deltaproteobacteria bacterium]|nr:precorrin-6y C5,15-methyltransferase (decarboxylating) subunit CbiE [Deltaproteobacteria bacterium]
MKPVQVVGLGLGLQDVTPAMAAVIDQAEILAGGRRLLDWFPNHQAPRLVLETGLHSWLEKVAEAAKEMRVVVLASGDPGFFGVAGALRRRLGSDLVRVMPNVSAMQAACARLNLSWDHAAHVSLHAGGDDLSTLWRAMSSADLVSVYTRPGLGPKELAVALHERGINNWHMHILQALGSQHELVDSFSPSEAMGRDFSALSVVLLQRTGLASPLSMGMPEDDYLHEGGLITKAEVRSVALAKLALGPGMTLWDIGAGSGSLGLEAGLLMPGGRVVALERKPERIAVIRANRAKFEMGMLEIVQGEAPAALSDMPDPHRVFVGGGGKDLVPIVRACAQRLHPNGVMVVNAVLLQSLETARRAMREAGLIIDETLLQISRGRSVAGQTMMKALNPVWLLRGRKPKGANQHDQA